MIKYLARIVFLALCTASASVTAQTATKIAVIGFQMSSETHARVVNAARTAAEAKGWEVQTLNSRGDMSAHIHQLDNLLLTKPAAIIVAMGKPLQAEDQFNKAKEAGIPVITVMSGTSPHALFDIAVNEYSAGAQAALYLLDQLNYQGNILTQRFEGNVGTRIRGKVLDVVLSENTAVKQIGSHTMARTASWRDDVMAGMNALLLKNQGNVDGIWASFDAQAYLIDDILRQQGAKKGKPVLVSIDGGPETYRRIADPDSLLMATVQIPFEKMGEVAVDIVEKVVVQKQDKQSINHGPYIYLDAQLIDASNVAEFLEK